MFYEIRKSVVAFRLKLIIETETKKNNAYIFVDTFETPSVDSLLQEISRKFNLENEISITLHDCEVLPSENVLVLADVDEVRIRSKGSKFNACHINESAEILHDETSLNNENIESLPSNDHSISRNEYDDDVLSKKSHSTEKRGKKKSYSHRGLATFLEQLQEEERTRMLVDDSNNITNCQELVKENKRKSHNVHKSKKNDTFYSEIAEKEYSNLESLVSIGDETTTELNEPYADTNEFTYEKKKRKRKRKHSRKSKVNIIEDLDELDVPPENETCVQTTSRKHIYFEDVDDVDDADETDNTNISDSDRVRETKMLKFIDETAPRNTTSSSFYTFNEKSPESDSTMQKSVISANKKESMNSGQHDRLEQTNSDTESASICSDGQLLQKHSQISSNTEKQLGTLLMYKELKTCGQYNVQYVSSGKSDARREKVNVPFHDDSDNESKINYGPKDADQSKIMRKNSLTKENEKILPKQEPFEDEIFIKPRRKSSLLENISTNGTSKTTLKEITSDSRESLNGSQSERDEDETLDDCEMVLQSKVIDDRIFMRSANSEWKLLTAEKAAKELPPVTKLADGQSIVFQLLYLKHNVWPTLSELIFGRVLTYNDVSKKVAIEIPQAFLEKLMRCMEVEEPTLPEGITCISGAVYELDWFILKNPKLLS